MIAMMDAYHFFTSQEDDSLLQQILGVMNATISQYELNARPLECTRSDRRVAVSCVAIASQPFVTGFTAADSAIMSAPVISTLKYLFFTNLDFVNMVMMVVLFVRPDMQMSTTLPAAAAMDAETLLHFFHADSKLYPIFRPYSELSSVLTSLTRSKSLQPEGDHAGGAGTADGVGAGGTGTAGTAGTAGKKRHEEKKQSFPSLELPEDMTTFNANVKGLLKQLSRLTLFYFEDQVCELLHRKKPSEENEYERPEKARDRARSLTLNHLLTKADRPGLETSREDIAAEEDRCALMRNDINTVMLMNRKINDLLSNHLLLCRSGDEMNVFTAYANLFASHFVTFTGVGHEIMSNPGCAHAHSQFMQALRTYLVHFEKAQAAFQKTADYATKRQHMETDRSGAAQFKEVHVLMDKLDKLAATLPEHVWSDEWKAYEALRTELLGTLVRQCSGDYIAHNDELFEPEDVVCVLRNPFTQLLKYLHVFVPVQEEGAARVDTYYVHVLALVRKYYVYALQQIAIVIVVLCRTCRWGWRCCVP